MKNRIEKFKDLVRAKSEKEIYKSSIPLTVMYTVGDGGEYTKDEAELMAHFYNNENRIHLKWLIEDIKRTYALDSLKDKGVVVDAESKWEWVYLDIDKEAIKRTKQKTCELKRGPKGTGLTIAQMEEIERLLKNIKS